MRGSDVAMAALGRARAPTRADPVRYLVFTFQFLFSGRAVWKLKTTRPCLLRPPDLACLEGYGTATTTRGGMPQVAVSSAPALVARNSCPRMRCYSTARTLNADAKAVLVVSHVVVS
jgi:hypothetical protein